MHVLAVMGAYATDGAFVQAMVAATAVVALCAFLVSLLTPPIPTGWSRCQLLGGILLVLAVNHY
jgi:multisubunit Na+/H+ antiporter MnhB subunit